MPILDIGYRPWQGERTPEWLRWTVVARTGIMLVWRGAWLKRLMMLALLPTCVALFGVGLFERSIQEEQYRLMVDRFLQDRARPLEESGRPPNRNGNRWTMDFNNKTLQTDPASQRHFAWSTLMLWFFRYPQALWIVVVIGLVAPRLISYDLRSRGYLLYLSRPLSPSSYVFGKACVLFFLLAMITTVPALVVYIAGLLLSNDPQSILQTWDIPLRILLATTVLVLPTSAIAIAFSSLTQESRFAAFGWFALWIVGWVTYLVLTGASILSVDDLEMLQQRWFLVSPYHILGHLQEDIFGLLPDERRRAGPWVISALATVIGFSVARWRVARMLKV